MEESKDVAAAIGNYADRKAQEFEENSSFVQTHELRPILRLDWQDVTIGALIGKGGYSDVHICEFQDVNKVKELDPDHSEHFVVKKLRSSSMCEKGMFIRSASDLLIESKILSRMQHPNIIKLYATKRGSASTSFRGSINGYFLIYEMLYDLLDNRMDSWRKQKTLLSGWRKPSKKDMFRRLKVAFGIAKAMEYLHSHRIIFRDIKPENAGFDVHDTVRLFDFGFAREMPTSDKLANGERRKMSMAGTIRYMAPEVPTQHYGLPVDVYSFGMFFWEVTSLKPLLRQIKTEYQFMEEIKEGPILPPLKQAHLSHDLNEMTKACWSANPEDRPTFDVIAEKLRKECKTLSAQITGGKKK